MVKLTISIYNMKVNFQTNYDGREFSVLQKKFQGHLTFCAGKDFFFFFFFFWGGGGCYYIRAWKSS